MERIESDQVREALGGVRYPATKEQLVDHARGNKASQDILDALETLPDREYKGPIEVSEAVNR